MTGLVGRGPELGALSAAVDAALAGTVQVALITGEPGIGKTRLGESLADVAASRGVEVLWSVCSGRAAPAFWPWAQALRSHVDNVGGARLAAELGDGAAELATILPELRQRLPALPEPDRAEGAAARYRTFAAVTRFLVRAASNQPLAVILDDLHEADRASLRLLEFVVREARSAPIVIAATYRSTPTPDRRPLNRVVAELLRHRSTTLVTLTGLSPAQVGDLVAEAHDGTPWPPRRSRPSTGAPVATRSSCSSSCACSPTRAVWATRECPSTAASRCRRACGPSCSGDSAS